MPPIIETLIDRPGRFVASLVESKPAYQARERWERPALVAILLIAAIVRFWGVGSFSLHKPDEDTTALPAVHILVDGTPRFPSGFFYARAIAQSYLIAGSVKAFGQTEWALRLPSVLCGLLVVWLSYFLGRRFLAPPWNLAFVTVVALLPGMIADSQEVRMYIFLSASLAAFMIYVFRWERTGQRSALVASVLAMLVAIQFQEIALFSSLLLLFPGLAHADTAKLRAAVVALLIIGLGYLAISEWVSSFYPPRSGDLPVISATGTVPTAGGARLHPLILAAALIFGGGLTWMLIRPMRSRVAAAAAGALLLLGLLAQGLIFYYLGFLMIAAGLIVARRNGGAQMPAMLLLLATCGAIAVVHVMLLHREGILQVRKLLGVMVGIPSIWPCLQVADYSPVAMLLVLAGLAVALWRLSRGGKVDDDSLFAMLGIFVPLFVIGFFGWYIPPRYAEFALLPLLVCAMASAQRAVAAWIGARKAQPKLAIAVPAALCAALVLNPTAVARSVNSGKQFADHKSAAQYIRSLHVAPRDIVIAEEALMQTYYLGKVDYWLTGPNNASPFGRLLNGRLVDTYTATPVIYSGAALQALVDQADRGTIYIIGSGENQEDGRLYLRGPEIFELLKNPEFQTVYVAPDGLSKVWKVPPPAHDGSVR